MVLHNVPLSQKRNKFIIVQIDGLSYSLVQKLRQTRYMPFLKRLLKSYHITSYEPGYPTTTPFVQAGIFYGENYNIPGFRFFDKEQQRLFLMHKTKSAKHIADELEKGKSILRGGASIGTLLSGGAHRKILTVSSFNEEGAEKTSLHELLSLTSLNPFIGLRAIIFFSYEFFVEMYESFFEIISSLFYGRPFNWPFFYPYFPFFRAAINGFSREVMREAALLELKRGTPYIYLNFYGYDWSAHYRGPYAMSGYSILTGIDFSLRKIYKKAIKKGYDFYVISDHGQVPSVPFESIYYETFDTFFERVANIKSKVIQTQESGNNSYYKWAMYKLKYLYDNFSLPLRAVGWWGMMVLASMRKKKDFYEREIDWGKRQSVIVYSSCLAHVYFNYTKRHMNLSEIEEKHPTLLSQLVNHPGIGFVIGKEGEKIRILNARGEVIIEKSKVEYKGEHFLRTYGKEEKLVKQLSYFAQLKYSGDLIVNGAFDGEKIVAFESFHFGSHDGVGGKQSDAFFISKEKISLKNVMDARGLYPIFAAYHQDHITSQSKDH